MRLPEPIPLIPPLTRGNPPMRNFKRPNGIPGRKPNTNPGRIGRINATARCETGHAKATLMFTGHRRNDARDRIARLSAGSLAGELR